MDELDEVRLKEPDELTDEEKGLLKEHQDELSDEEKDAFKSVIEPKEEEPKEEEPFKTFKTQDELDAFLEENKSKEELEDKEEEGGVEPANFFPDDYKPKNWNEFANDLLPKLKPEIRKETEAFTEDTKRKIGEINAQFDAEIEQLRVIDPNIPEVGTSERVAFDKSLAQVAIKNKDVRTMTQAYSIYKAEQGNKGDDNKEDEVREDLAKKVGGGSKSEGASKEKKYADITSTSDDDAWEAALKDLETGS